MKQEDYNSIMKYPWEISRSYAASDLKKCPNCEFEYLGNGIDLCVDCKCEVKKSKIELVERTE